MHEQVGEALQNAADVLQEEVGNKLFFTISEPKAALIASTPRLARRIRLALGRLAGPELVAVRNLGVDVSAARRRVVQEKSGVRAKRFTKCKARIHNILRFTTRRKLGVRKLSSAG